MTKTHSDACSVERILHLDDGGKINYEIQENTDGAKIPEPISSI